MAQINFDQLPTNSGATTSFSNQNSVGFFSLKNDGDKAIVRFMHDSTTDFDVVSTHSITVNGRFRKVSCIRTDASEPLENCPLCASRVDTSKRIFIHLIQYVQDTTGAIVPEPKVWERSLKYAYDLKDKINNFGPLSESLFIITRHGKAGDMQTTYSIDYAVPNMYPVERYPKIADAFKGYKALGTIVLNKTVSELEQFITTGEFPAKVATADTSNDYIATPAYEAASYSTGSAATPPAANKPAPWETNTGAPQRPVRTY